MHIKKGAAAILEKCSGLIKDGSERVKSYFMILPPPLTPAITQQINRWQCSPHVITCCLPLINSYENEHSFPIFVT